ncbi:flagellar hook-associated protein FlgK [Jatrophihabitans fulvus]
MSNWFAGINQASSGLAAARYGLSVVAENMANVSTPGYTRQTPQLATAELKPIASIHSGSGTPAGVTIAGTSRSTDLVLDARVRGEHAKSSLADTTSAALDAVGSILGEPSETGLASQLDTFWNDWGTLTTDNGGAARSVLLRDAGAVAATLNTMASALDDLAASTSQALGRDAGTVTTAASQLAEVNGQIAVGNATGANVNALLDRRDSLLDSLSSLSGATATIQPDGTASVTLGGAQLVSGVTAATVSVDAGANVTVDGVAVTVSSGSMAARSTLLTTTLPAYRTSLDAVADALSATVNAAQTSGYDADGNPGAAMFGGSGAAGIQVVLTDPKGVAAASVAGGSRDTGNARLVSQYGTRPGGPDSTFNALVGTVGSAAAAAARQSDTQGAVTNYVDKLKAATSGVSLDEEAANMLVYQQAFNASSRVLTAIDSMLDTLINHTGLVGRA